MSRWRVPGLPGRAPRSDQNVVVELRGGNAHRNRSGFLSLLVYSGWIVLICRLIHLQTYRSESLTQNVIRQSISEEILPARPGDILDRNGHVLAMTVMCDSVYAVPRQIRDPLQFAWRVGEILDLTTDELYQRLQQHPDAGFIWLKRRVDPQQTIQLRNAQLEQGSWGIRREYLRHYLQDGYAAHVLGLRNIDNNGQGGLEEYFDEDIRGSDGVRFVVRDALGRVVSVDTERSRPPRNGQSIVSSIDLPLQVITESVLDELMAEWQPAGACAIVMEPHSGEILAMASRPAFHPGRLQQVDPTAWKNLAVSAVFEPGSTLKPAVAGWAIETGAVNREQSIHCGNGLYRMGPRLLHDHHPYGALSLTDVLVKSSNIGMAKIGEALGTSGLYEAVRAFGFGQLTGIELPGELAGIVHPPERWTIYSLGSVPMGQEIAVTPLQLITAHAAIANGGLLTAPTLLRQSSGPGPAGERQKPVPDLRVPNRLLSPATAAWLTAEPMRQVVERGTARSVRVPDLSVFGKTGTAQKLDAQTGRYASDAWVLSFVCGTPADAPRLLTLVMVDAPSTPGSHYGGTVAAPAAVRILRAAADRIVIDSSETLEDAALDRMSSNNDSGRQQ